LKLKSFIKAISNANECLKMEPGNIKALIRKGQAFAGEKMFSEAYDTFEKVLDIDAANQVAHHEMAVLRKKMPPRNAFKMKIEEVEDDISKTPEKRVITKSEKLELPDSNHVPKMVQNIVIEEPTLFDKLTPKSKENKSRETLVMPTDVQSKKKSILIEEIL
jgi:predicted TPR repeat methyltransferase